MFKLLSDVAVMPVRATIGSAGYDLFAAETKTVHFDSGTVMIKTNVAASCPPDTYGRIAIRSSLAYNQHLAVNAGVIDADYYPRDIGVLVYCTKPGHSYTIKQGEKFAQIVFEKIFIGNDEVTDTRVGGYGSTNGKPLEGKITTGRLRVGECEVGVTDKEFEDLLMGVSSKDHLVDTSSGPEDVGTHTVVKRYLVDPHALSPALQKLMDGDRDDEMAEML